MSLTAEEMKMKSAYEAVYNFIESDFVVGLGTGSTVFHVINYLATRLNNKELKNIRCIPTSKDTELKAKEKGLTLIPLDHNTVIDVTIDGADEIDKNLNLVKGRGGALLREKMVAENSKKLIIVADESKYLPGGLGTSGYMPVEIVQFGNEYTLNKLKNLHGVSKVSLRKTGTSDNKETNFFVTDNQNFIAQLYFDKPIQNPSQFATTLDSIVGVVEHGLFIGMASNCLITKKTGILTILNRNT